MIPEWLPNTYYVKLANRPAAERVQIGLRQNWPILPTLALAWSWLLLRGLRDLAYAVRLALISLLGTFTASVLSSIHNGGDLGTLRFGYDRFGALGSFFFVLFLLVIAALRPAPASLLLVAALGFAPVLLDPYLRQIVRLAAGEWARAEKDLVAYGKAFKQSSLPGSVIAIGPAGAIPYFSHRGAYDVNGKCDRTIARQEIRRRGTTQGHMKYDLPSFFLRLRPEFSREPPPPEFAGAYVRVRMRGFPVWIRRDSARVRWEELVVLER